MKVNINNKETETQALNVKQLAEELNLPAKGVAIAISNSKVHRRGSRHRHHQGVLWRMMRSCINYNE